MKIEEMFVRPIDREITTVIKVDDLTAREVAQEIEEYVVTDTIEDNLLKFLDAYNSTRFEETERIGVWISGFFGSGKSHFAKMLGHLLENRQIDSENAMDKFLIRVEGSSRVNEIKAQLHELKNNFSGSIVMFQIRAEAYGEYETITEIMYRQFLVNRNLSPNIQIARIEIELISEGKFDEFNRTIAELTGKSWEEVRKKYLFARPMIVKALFKMFPDRYTSEEQVEKALDAIREEFKLSPSTLAEKLTEYLKEIESRVPEKTARLGFIVDEMGQFIGDKNEKLLELQSIAEQFGSKGKGRLWLIVTSQEKLEEVIEGVGQKIVAYSKIMDRFDIRLEMTSENIEKVLEERILKKKEVALPEISKDYSTYQGNIVDIATLQNTSRALPECNEENFTKAYPFLPYQFMIMQPIFASIRSKAGPSTQLTGSERSMLGVTQGVLKSPKTGFKESELGRLVTLDEIYDQVENEVPTEIRRTINEVESKISYPDFPLSKISKALYLLQQLDWIPRDLENMTKVLANETTVNIASIKEKVKAGLDRLIEGKYVILQENQYEFLSGAKRSIMEEIASVPVKEGDKKRKAKEFLKIILPKDRVNYENIRWFNIKVYGDDEEFSAKGDIKLKVHSPILVQKVPNLDKDTVLRESLADNTVIYWLSKEDGEVEQKITRIFQIEEVLKNKDLSKESDEGKQVLRELNAELDNLKKAVEKQIRSGLLRGTIIFDGDSHEIDERMKDIDTVIHNEVTKAIPKIYAKFDKAAFKVSEKGIKEILQAPPNLLADIEKDVGLFDKNGQLNRQNAAVEEVFSEIKERVNKGGDTTGKDLIDYFEGIPYGWDPIFLRIVLASLFRDGAIILNFENKVFRDFRKPEAQELLTNIRRFNHVKVDYEEEGIELTIQDRQKVKTKLESTFGGRLSDNSVNTLSSALEEDLERMVDDQKNVLIRCESADLPLYDKLKRTEEVISSVLQYPKPSKRIKEFIVAMEDIADAYKHQTRVRRFIDEGKLDEFKRLKAIKEKAEQDLGYFGQEHQHKLKSHIDEINRILDEKKVIEKWPELVENCQRIISFYRSMYSTLHQEANGLYSGFVQGIKANPTYSQISLDPYVAEIEGYICADKIEWGENEISCQRCQKSLEGLKLKIESFEGIRRDVQRRIIGEINAKQKRKVTSISLNSLVTTRRIENEEQLEKALEEIKKALLERIEKNEIINIE